ncbi:MAG: DUF3187 family protein [Pseudomonadales bacterium]|jgi:hypothetical protein|nr:DUF3187 family protein [Pseudomonadales bacterium]
MAAALRGLPLFAALAIVAADGRAAGPVDAPFLWRNAAPTAAVLGLPRPRAASLPEAGETALDLLVEVASHFTSDTRGSEFAYLDAETLTTSLLLERGFGDGWAVALEIPVLRHSTGFLDAPINSWHDVFGLPDAGRDRVANGNVRMDWVADGISRFSESDSLSGIGDLRLGVARRLHASPDRDITLRLDLELPTGGDDGLLGSGGTDVALGLGLSDRRLLASVGGTLHLHAGLLRSGDAPVYGDELASAAAFGTLAVSLPLGASWTLRGQLDAHSQLVDSALYQVGGWSVQGGLGLGWQPGDAWRLEAAFFEDLRPGSAPDVAFQFALRSRF